MVCYPCSKRFNPVVLLICLALAIWNTLPTPASAQHVKINHPVHGALLPQNSRLYINDNDEDFVLLPNNNDKNIDSNTPQFSFSPTSVPITQPKVTMPFFQQQSVIVSGTGKGGVITINIDDESQKPTGWWTLGDVIGLLKSPMIIGFIILGILAWILYTSFTSMDQEELREFSRLSKNFHTFQNLQSLNQAMSTGSSGAFGQQPVQETAKNK